MVCQTAGNSAEQFRAYPGTASALVQYLPYSIPANAEIVAVPRPINHKGFAPQFVVSDKTPEPAVVAVVAVVAHDEQAVGRNGKRGEVVTGGICRRDRVRVLVDGIGVVLGLAIHEDLLVVLLDNITGYAHTRLI